ncbi:MAG: hypothetical protein JWQ79_2087 [Mucilaginibacter sp.]|nr:hypothetical protein [Mucilaginibacter sp.]
MNQLAGQQYDIKQTISEGYLKKNSIFPNSRVVGFVNIKYEKADHILLNVLSNKGAEILFITQFNLYLYLPNIHAMTKKSLSVLFLFLILQSCTHAQTFNKAKLDSFFVALNTHDENMGSIAIAVNGVVVYQNTIGYSRVNENVKTPATTKTKYRIGSISKMFTATMIFQLIDEGKLRFDAPLASYFPQLPNAEKITIAEMLDHRSGLHNFTNDSLYTTYMTTPKSEAEMIAIIARLKSDFEPDAKAEYSNTNFVLLGYIIEKLTGKTYAEELETHHIQNKPDGHVLRHQSRSS